MKNLLSFEKFNENSRYVPKGAVTNPTYVPDEYDYLAWAVEKAYEDADEAKDPQMLADLLKAALKESDDSGNDIPNQLYDVLYDSCEEAIAEFESQQMNGIKFFKQIQRILLDYGHDFEDAWVGEPGSSDFDDEEDLGGSYTADEDEDDD